jgi:hypothetical protein
MQKKLSVGDNWRDVSIVYYVFPSYIGDMEYGYQLV